MSARQCRPLHDSVIAEIHSIDRLIQSNNQKPPPTDGDPVY